MSHEIQFSVRILGVTFVFRGFDAIKDLVEFCQQHASESYGELRVERGPEAVPPPDREGEGEDGHAPRTPSEE